MTATSLELPHLAPGEFLLTAATVEAFLRVSYGVEEAELAAQLPVELQMALYQSSLEYGPALNQIEVLVHAIENVSDEHPLWDYYGILQPLMFQPKSGNMDEILTAPNYFIRKWSKDNDFNILDASFDLATDSLGLGWSHHTFGTRIIMWSLTGQYLFDAEAVDCWEPIVPTVNHILFSLGMEPLSGKLKLSE